MKKLNKNLLCALISILVFILFMVSFSFLSSLVRGGAVDNIEFSQIAEAIIASIMFLPLFSFLFFLSRFFKDRGLYPIGTTLKFMSIGLFIFSLVQIFLSLIGFYS